MHSLRYGSDSVLHLAPGPAQTVTDLTVPASQPLDDPAAAVAAALVDPLDFPPLCAATVPGDRIVLALDPEVPELSLIVAGVLETLLHGRTQPDEITLLLPHGSAATVQPALLTVLSAETAQAVRVIEHDPADGSQMAYLAASKENKPIYVNRHLFDADLIVPIGCLRPEDSFGYVGVPACLFPAFSDAQTQQRFRAPASAESAVHHRRRCAEADEAAWLLGAQFVIQVVPGPGDTILHVLAGDRRAVGRRGRELCQAEWHYRVARRASLVVAAIEGGPDQQTWENVARALFAACQVVAENGTVVLCTGLQSPPGPALKRLAAGADDDDLDRQLHRERSPDATCAALLLHVLRGTRVYLLSGLDGEAVEDLGVGYIADEQELIRLTLQHASWILVGNAHRASLEVAQ